MPKDHTLADRRRRSIKIPPQKAAGMTRFGGDSRIWYKHSLPERMSVEEAYERIKHLIPKERSTFMMFGKKCTVPRDAFTCKAPGLPDYKYTGGTANIEGFPGIIGDVLRVVEKRTKETFDYCVVNIYHKGDSIGDHHDNEKGLDPKAPVVSYTLTNDDKAFVFRVTPLDKTKPRIDIPTPHESLIVLSPETNKDFKHGVVCKREAPADVLRISFTFRKHMKNESRE